MFTLWLNVVASQWWGRLKVWWADQLDPQGYKATYYGRPLTEKQWYNQAMARVNQIHAQAAQDRYYRQEAMDRSRDWTGVVDRKSLIVKKRL